MHFEWLRLRFDFTALERVVFPPVLAANILRGALGVISRQLTCRCSASGPHNPDCLYARVFEPVAHVPGPSGLSDHPRPFVFRARHLDGQILFPGAAFHFHLNLFDPDPVILSHLRDTFSALEQHGLGPSRGKVRLTGFTTTSESVDLTPPTAVAQYLTVNFLSPTELKASGRIAEKPDFPTLFSRARDRIATLSSLYGPGPLDVDFPALGQRAVLIRLTASDLHQVQATRYSTRTGQTHSLGGFTGSASYAGDLAEFLPWLQAAEATGVGRQAVWGKGEIRLSGI